jgi:hypothetical protein
VNPMPLAAQKAEAQTPPIPAQGPRGVTTSAPVLAPVSTPVAVPATAAAAAALNDRVTVLSGQLSAANSRRNQLSSQLRNSVGGPDRLGLEERIGQLDKRIIQIETDIADVGRALSAAPGGLGQSTTVPPRNYYGPNPGQVTAISIVGTIFVLFPLAIAYARLLWRRSMHPPAPAAASPDITNRLERMEQGIEVITLEVERISEGQRFVSQLMSDNAKRAAPEPVRLPNAGPRTA